MRTTTINLVRAAHIAAAKALRQRVRNAHVTWLNGRRIVKALASGALVTISTALTNLGADTELVRRYASHAGKKVRAAHIDITGADPRKVWSVQRGHVVQVFAYAATDPALTAGFAGYNRTAHLVAN